MSNDTAAKLRVLKFPHRIRIQKCEPVDTDCGLWTNVDTDTQPFADVLVSCFLKSY